MYVCVCNGFTDRQIRGLAEGGGYRSAAGVHRALGGRVRCGKCLPMVAEMVRGCEGAGEIAAAGSLSNPG